ncbi:MAG: PhoPQ-activated pathogenicity-related family protein [Dysgonamonadaceae bacterium]|jgi:PhoPQ-activated pathogenicity-related protein|nr:PhoPQ-activated pathogenicity-related family protein [Dysgonamonadaceae bacterium]
MKENLKISRRICFFLLALSSTFVAGYAQQITPETALERYIHNDDRTFGWEIRDTCAAEGVKIYSLTLYSQKWQNMIWKHELIVCVPETLDKEVAMLFVNGGSINGGFPKIIPFDDGITTAMATMAVKNKALAATLRQVPNQPLYDGLNEDALISYTLEKFRKTGDYSLPLLFPMVKSAVSAMDAVQEFAMKTLGKKVSGFVVSGASKRGWTTWLTGAIRDSRVIAIAPMVIDMLNMPLTLDYQKKLYGEYSEQINDYVKMDIPQMIHSDEGKAIVAMLDPYSYRQNITMPKMLIMGTNDPYWTVDAVKHYLPDIPGTNFLVYVPDAGHGLGNKKQALTALNAFFGFTLTHTRYPVCSWEIAEKGKHIELKISLSPEKIVAARLWKATSDSRDFRKSKWASSNIALKNGDLQVKLSYPAKDYQAFYVELTYKDVNNEDFTVCTQIYTADRKHVFINE